MFTVVIPLYNKELSIKNTIKSVLNQTCQDFEIVVVNDGSTDNSVKMVKSIKDNRIRLIQQKNQGVSAARNRGIKEASYDWIAFLDADDLWEVNHLEEINKMMALFPDEKIYVTSFEYSDGRVMFKHKRQTPIFKIEKYFQEALKENIIWTSIVVVNKYCFSKVGGFNTVLTNGEDLELWARLAREWGIVKSSATTATYRKDAENRTSLNRKVEKTHVYHFNLDDLPVSDEKIYYKHLILARLYDYCRALDFNCFIKLKNKHSQLSYIEVTIYIFSHLKKRLKQKMLNF
ncbi:glycosyltransferase family A protein [Psychrobacter sp. Ps3]|uniref:glycosyltransferase family 2 protein n=1 Tax=Psychrobacter sp. Ps3 TaxID=2790957 RepID=UPI001EDF4673|nr:glycosyltransferase family A protein [Psychrobacter sp. Ps3]MCG3881880.1 glycosyltransferase family 2 protein [Psychrobacter sp. Ps3]